MKQASFTNQLDLHKQEYDLRSKKIKHMKRIIQISTFTIIFLFVSTFLSASPLIVAHRGASHDAPENTLPAFELAWEQGIDAIEGDFQLTRDGEIVCIHDKTTKKVSNQNLVVSQSTLKELRQLDVGSWFGKKWKGTPIPTLAEVLHTVPDTKYIFIEIKSGPEILPKLFQELRRSQLRPEQVRILSFHAEVIFEFKRNMPGVKAFLLSMFKKDQSTGQTEPTVDDILEMLRLAQADGLSLEAHSSVNTAFVRRILDAGYEYHVWTVDNVRTAKKFQNLGAMSIMTNVPELIKKKLQKHKKK